MVGCKQTTNSAMGDANKFLLRGNCASYPSGYLLMASPKTGSVELAGASPLSVTMRLEVGVLATNDWGTLTGWCVSWGDGTQSTGTFGSPTADYEGFLYCVANNISHTYYYDDTTTDYTSRSYRPWATISDTCGNQIVIDYGQYIHVCRSDASPDKSGGCSVIIQDIPEIIGSPPTTVCTHGEKLCVRDTGYAVAVGYLCEDGAWTFDADVTNECWDQNPDVVPIVCVDRNVECRSDNILYTCTGNKWVPGKSCGDTPLATLDDHGCIIGSSTWCESKQRCVQTGIESCCITGSADIHGCICNTNTWCAAEGMCKLPNQLCGAGGIGTYDTHGCLIASQMWCASENKCKLTGSSCETSGTGDEIISGQTFGVDNKTLMMGGIALLGVLLLFGGVKSAERK